MVALVLVVLLIGQPATAAAATEHTTGPVYGGTFSWATPALTVVPPTGVGFLGVTAFRGRFVAVERNGIASTSIDGVTWVGHALPGPIATGATSLIAAGSAKVVIITEGAAWASLDGEAWTAASPPIGPARPKAITRVADGFVAVGIAPGDRRAAAWRSVDGSSWTASADQPAFDHFCPTAVATAPMGRVVAVGDDCNPYVTRPAAAISDDGGLSWRRAPAQSQLSEAGWLSGVAPGGPGLVAVGAAIPEVYPGWPPGTVMFVSADGLAWRRVGYFPEGQTYYRYPQQYLSVIPGGYLAIAMGGERSSAFVSADGVRWTRSSSVPATPNATNDDYYEAVNGFAVNGNAIVGVGITDHNLFVDIPVPGAFTLLGTLTPGPAVTGRIPVPPAVPTPRPPSVAPQPSFPGKVSWAVAPLPVNAPPGDRVVGSTVTDVTRWGGGFAAVGSESFEAAPARRDVVWTSVDGIRWIEHPLPADCRGEEIAATQTAIVVAGNAGICRSTDGNAWSHATDTPHQIRGLADIVNGGPGFILTMAHDSPTGVAIRVWRSADGLHWLTAGRLPGFSQLAPTAVTTGPRGLVVLGRRWVPGSGPAVTPMRSSDGITWLNGVTQLAFQPEGAAEEMISGGPGYIAAGSYQPRSRTGAAVWTSLDGLVWKRVYFVLPPSGLVEFDALARIGPGYAVVGLLASSSEEVPARPTVWLSPDGSRWRSGIGLPLPADGLIDGVEITSAAGGSARIVAVGNRSGPESRQAAEVWTGTHHAP